MATAHAKSLSLERGGAATWSGDDSQLRHVEALTALLDDGAELEATNNGRTALAWAAAQNQVDAINLLLDRGAELEATTNDGMTPLTLAAVMGSVDAVKLLLDRGAAYVADNYGVNPYDQACEAGKPENKASIQELLVQRA